MHLYRERNLDRGMGVFSLPGTDMMIDTYIRWMLVFSSPFFVISAFTLYRLIMRLNCDRKVPASH